MSQKAVKINKCNKTANINVKKNFQFKTVCNGDTAYIAQLKQQKIKKKVLLLRSTRRQYDDVLPKLLF